MNNIKKDALIFLSFLCFGSVLSSLLRFEIFTDLINYHYYNGFSFLNNRLTYDVAPAGFHSFFNPLADTVTYLLVRTLNDRPAVYFALTGLSFGILLFVCFKINPPVFPSGLKSERQVMKLRYQFRF